MGQSGGPEQECVLGVTSPTAPAKMEVVMGKCFPLNGPGHHLNFPSYPVSQTTTSTKKVEVCHNQSPPQPSHTILKKSQSTPQSTQLNGIISNIKHTPSTRESQKSTNNNNKADLTTETKREAQIITTSQPAKPIHPILRRTQSSATTEQEPQPNNKSTDSLLARIKAKVEQITPNKEDISGKEAWDITQKKKALMREEFFKIPYEECNKEAAMSLGGRLNKSEPRLNTLCKDRKKRNSLSYKRRVHFDLDEDKDLDDDRPSAFRRRHSLQRIRNVAPPKKVVVSIYSIDDPAKRVQQVQLPENYTQFVQESIVSSTVKPESCQIVRDKNYNKIKTARPTDLDSLQRDRVADKMTSPETSDTHFARVEAKSQPQDGENGSTSKSVSPNFVRSIASSIEQIDKTGIQYGTPATDGFQRRYSLPPPLRHTGISVRPRQPSAHFPSNSQHTTQQQHSTNTSPTTPNGPIPAPRSNKTHFKTSQSQDNSEGTITNTSSSSSCPRPDTLQLRTSTSETPSQINNTPGSLSSLHITGQIIPLSSQKVMSYMSSTSPHAKISTDSSNRTSTSPQSPKPCVSPKPRELSSPGNPPVPMPRKRISVSQQTGTPSQSPSHVKDTHTNHTLVQSNSSQSNTQTHSDTLPLHSSNHNSQSQIHSPQSSTNALQSKNQAPQSNTQTSLQTNINTPQSKPVPPQSKPATPQTKPVPPQSKPAIPQTKPPIPQTKPIPPQTKPVITQSNPVTPLTKPVPPQAKPVTPQTNPIPPQRKPVIPQTKPVTPQTKTNTQSQPNTRPPQSPQTNTIISKSNTQTYSPLTNTTISPTSHPTQPTTKNIKTTNTSELAKPASYAPLYQTFSSPHVNHTSPQIIHTQLKPQKSCPQIVQSNRHVNPPLTSPTEQQTGPSLNNKATHKNPTLLKPELQKTVPPLNNKATHKTFNKENQRERSNSQKTNLDGKGNSINIVMTKGESYSKHSIVLKSHVNSTTPSVTVKKIYMPTSAPARCSPSPTPSCASSSCSFGSSGSSSGCFSGSPSPTPTPSPTRIRSSGVPTDL